MLSNGYEFRADESYLNFEFNSIGPKGPIKKVVRFTPRNSQGITYFNLAFGDWDASENRINDVAISNNHDTKRILLTVATIVVEFLNQYPDMFVFAEGSTTTRTRLYQIAIATNISAIRSDYEIYGLKVNGYWEEFVVGTNYKCFVARRRKKT